MFEIGRELRRFFAPSRPRDGFCQGDLSLLELLDLKLLEGEARSADVAAGRIGATDRAQRLVEAAAVRRELARRTGDPAALRKAASCAEQAAEIRRREGRGRGLGQANCAQARIALLGAELFGDDGLNAAAGYLVGQAPDSTAARAIRARLAARRALSAGDVDEVQAAARTFDAPLAEMAGRARAEGGDYALAQLRGERAEFLMCCGARLREPRLIEAAMADLDRARAGLDEAYHPLAVSRIHELRGLSLLRLGELAGEVATILDGVDALSEAVDLAAPDHSPLDWARCNHGLGLGLMALGEAGSSPLAFDRALQALGKAQAVLEQAPSVVLRAAVVQDRAACLVRRAELMDDSYALDEAEAILRGELASQKPAPDPVPWAVLQMNLARVYMAQAKARGGDRGEAARAGEALAAALDVFAERGLRSLAVIADAGLQRLRTAANPIS